MKMMPSTGKIPWWCVWEFAGPRPTMWYLLFTALVLAVLYTIMNFESYYQLIFLLPVPLLISDINTVITNTVPVELNRELKRLAMATLLFSISFGIGLVL